MSNLVQPILIRKGGTHLEAITMAATASLMAAMGDEDPDNTPVWNEWLAGPFTKTVRRASDKDFEKVISWAKANGFRYKDVDGFGNRALALSPMTYPTFPKALSKLQVSGTDFERADSTIHGKDCTIFLDETLTTGKAAAQAAHALWVAMGIVAKRAGKDGAVDTIGAGIVLAPPSHLNWLSGRDDCQTIRDNGLTEVAPDTLTAVILPEGNMLAKS